MSKYLIGVVFIYFLMMYCVHGHSSVETLLQKNSVDLFVSGKTNTYTNLYDGTTGKSVNYFYSPFLVMVDDVMIVFAETDYTYNGKNAVDIITRYIEMEGSNWVRNVIGCNGGNWKTQFAIQNNEWDNMNAFRKPLAVVKGKNIFLLAIKYDLTISKVLTTTSRIWYFVLAVAKVSNDKYDAKGKKIEWGVHELPFHTLAEQFRNQSLVFLPYGHGGSAFLTDDGKIVFVMRAFRENTFVSVLIYLKDLDGGFKLELVYFGVADDCYTPSFFAWEGKLIMVPSYCRNGGVNRLKESTDMGKTWTDSVGPIARLSNYLRDKKDFTIVIIENRTVLLFTQLIERRTNDGKAYDIHLWFLEGSRVHDTGRIITDDRYVTSSGLIYTNDELFSLHQRWNKKPESIFLLRLKDKLKVIKSVLKKWAKLDEYFLQPCKASVRQSNLLGNSCSISIPTDGLVGFLSNSISEGVWHDEYLYFNAEVRWGRPVNNGFEFSVAESGVRWPVVKQWEREQYNLKNYGLTVIAMVTINEVPVSESNSLLTVGLLRSYERPGLWYSKDKHWKIMSDRGGKAILGGVWETNRTYIIAVMLRNNTVSVYINGEHVGSIFHTSAEKEMFEFKHIFIGGYLDENLMYKTSNLTVTNVLLYNRFLVPAELDAVKRRLLYFVYNNTLEFNTFEEQFVLSTG